MPLGGAAQCDENWMLRAPRIHPLQLAPPPREQAQALLRVSDLIAQIVSPAAECINVVEILMQALGQQEADHVEIFIMAGNQPARVCQRFFGGPRALQLAGSVDKSGGREK